MTLMTTAQVGDWDHGTTGEPKDLYVTGDVHIGKTNGSLFVQGDIMVRCLPPPPTHPLVLQQRENMHAARPNAVSDLCSWTELSAQTMPISRVGS
jgi:hypothetical protein